MLGYATNTPPGSWQLNLSLPSFLHRASRSPMEETSGPAQVFPQYEHSPGLCLPFQVPRDVLGHFKPLWRPHSPAPPFSFWLVCCLSQLLLTTAGSHKVTGFLLFYFVSLQTPPREKALSTGELWVKWNKDNLVSGVFRGPQTGLVMRVLGNNAWKELWPHSGPWWLPGCGSCHAWGLLDSKATEELKGVGEQGKLKLQGAPCSHQNWTSFSFS